MKTRIFGDYIVQSSKLPYTILMSVLIGKMTELPGDTSRIEFVFNVPHKTVDPRTKETIRAFASYWKATEEVQS